MLESIERSLRQLRTEYVDLIQLHSCSGAELRKGDAIEALLRTRERGYARYVGYSGDGGAARSAVECGQFDVLQTSVSIADQEALELTLPLARSRWLGVIGKRPIANAVRKYRRRPADAYYRPYWERLRTLAYDFLRAPPPEIAAIALRFTLSVPGVHTAIVGTTKPGRWPENAELLKAGPLPGTEFEAIRARWREVPDSSWVGQV